MIWSEEKEPNEEIRYTHITCETPLGLATIEWKGWKDYDDRTLFLDGGYIGSFCTVDDAKMALRSFLKNKAKAIVEGL